MHNLRGVLLIVIAVGFAILLFNGISRASARPYLSEIVVSQHDTLWGIAVRCAPEHDPRWTIERIIRINHLETPMIVPGQHLTIPCED